MMIHVVKPGDTVYSIARQYNVPMERVISDNELADPSRLTPGQTLVILFPKRVVTVRPGDTLARIAAQNGTTVIRLMQDNPQLGGSGAIVPGQQLVLAYEEPKLGTLAVNGYAYPGIDRTVLRKTLPYLTYLSVFSTGFGPDGRVTPLNDGGLPDEARRYGADPLLVLSTLGPDGRFSGERGHVLLQSSAMRQNLIDSLAEYLPAHGYAGVDVDFEYLPPEDAEAYASFIRELTARLNPLGLVVFVALAPKTSTTQRGVLYESHDYAALANAANNALVMTYEWGHAGSEPMAVAPLNQVKRVMDFAVTQAPPEKLFMGVPNYGYDWTLPVEPGTRARSISNVAAVDQAIDVGAFIDYEWPQQAPTYTYWQDGRQHEVWFEDARSIRAKLDLASSLGLRGVSVWNIMRWFPQLWSVLNAMFILEKRR